MVGQTERTGALTHFQPSLRGSGGLQRYSLTGSTQAYSLVRTVIPFSQIIYQPPRLIIQRLHVSVNSAQRACENHIPATLIHLESVLFLNSEPYGLASYA